MITILTVPCGQSFSLGDDMEVVLLDVVVGQVRMGFQAPIEVSVDREEIWLRKQSQVREFES